jgi:hypothetical protein
MNGTLQPRRCCAIRVRGVQGCAEKVDVNTESPQHLTGRPLDIEHTAQHMVARDDI